MKRYVLLAALFAAAPLAGCEGDGSSSPTMNNPFKKKAAPTPTANYFEVKKEGKTYILGSRESLQKVTKGEAASLSLKEMPNYGPKGETVAFENNAYTDMNRLVAEYRQGEEPALITAVKTTSGGPASMVMPGLFLSRSQPHVRYRPRPPDKVAVAAPLADARARCP